MVELSYGERFMAAGGAAFISAIIVNPLDLAKTRLQAQAATTPTPTFHPNSIVQDVRFRCIPVQGVTSSNRYKGTLDILYKVIRQEGFMRLWRGTNASLALAVPTVGIYMPCYDIFRNVMEEFTTQNAPSLSPYVPLVAGSVARSLACVSCYPVELARTRMQAFRVTQTGKPPGVWKTLLGVINPVPGTSILQNLHMYRFWWTGLGAQLSRDVPFSAICWSTLEPLRQRLLGLVGDGASAGTVLGANFSAGFVAGSLAAATTCPLDVAKTRRQIEKDPKRALKMTTRTTLLEIWSISQKKCIKPFTQTHPIGFGLRLTWSSAFFLGQGWRIERAIYRCWSPCRTCRSICWDSRLFLRSCQVCFISQTWNSIIEDTCIVALTVHPPVRITSPHLSHNLFRSLYQRL
ncbi:unnamed protein product [Lupinus luteus]|uniref:Mitochondrial carrier protein MTM1 n=1 Tax=Lupinus luteus TaxID=3873 RepID=A0AAV1WI91_LUPLU